MLLKQLIEYKIGFKEILESCANSSDHMNDLEVGAMVDLRQDEILKIILYTNNQSFFLADDQVIKDNKDVIERWIKAKNG